MSNRTYSTKSNAVRAAKAQGLDINQLSFIEKGAGRWGFKAAPVQATESKAKEQNMKAIVIDTVKLEAFPLPEGDVKLADTDRTFNDANELANSDIALEDLSKIIGNMRNEEPKKQSSAPVAAKRIFRLVNNEAKSDKAEEKANKEEAKKPAKKAKKESAPSETTFAKQPLTATVKPLKKPEDSPHREGSKRDKHLRALLAKEMTVEKARDAVEGHAGHFGRALEQGFIEVIPAK